MPSLEEALASMKKREVWSIKNPSYTAKKTKRPIFLNSGLFPLVPILCFEGMVIVLGTRFFKDELGFGFLPSITTSFCIEYFYMYFSSKKGIASALMRFSFFILSVSCLTYSFYVDDPQVRRGHREDKKSEEIKEYKEEALKKKLALLIREEEALEKDMASYRSFGLISKGKRILGDERKRISRERESAWKKLKEVEKGSAVDQFKFEFDFFNLSQKTKIAILAISLIQIGICFSLPEIFKNFQKNSHNS